MRFATRVTGGDDCYTEARGEDARELLARSARSDPQR